ncbi:LPS assembly protein LptD [Psychrobacter sp. FDAARGOS_221]|uniref:LPS assembly protein LptD n=1 Tax=Psychrobacter sp. FDAARGOS_221 TaxID=1975705 RepID=UPI000BB55870|nr:LPS assembly protein LptD [Psychrobacter sp. FDAARGOS_221]PNK61410.1 LPS-assembly protein LptD [Psychrobacter sp. FDAARGOS_221]
MLYSQLYRSILRACREFSCHPQTTTRIAISLPLLISVPSAYGAIISPQAELSPQTGPTADLNMSQAKVEQQADPANPINTDAKDAENLDTKNINTKDTDTTPITAQLKDAAGNDVIKGQSPKTTLTDHSTVTYRRLNHTQSSTANTINEQALATQVELAEETAALDDLSYLNNLPLYAQNNAGPQQAHSDSTPKVAAKNASQIKTEEDALQAVGFDSQNRTNSDQTDLNTSNTTSAKQTTAVTNVPASPEDEYIIISPDIDATVLNNQSSNATGANTGVDDIDVNNESTANTTAENANNAFENARDNQRDEAHNLSDSFERDSVKQSLQRLSQFYQKQSSELRERLGIEDGVTQTASGARVIEAETMAPVIKPKILNYLPDASAAYRCEGVWVTPNNASADANYKQAVQRAQQQDGLSLTNGLPLHAQADYAYYDNANYVELSGNVEVMQDGKLVTADNLALDLESGIAGAKGGVLLADSGNSNDNRQPTDLESAATNNWVKRQSNSGLIAVADELAYNTNSSAATAHDVAFASVPMQAHGYAKLMNKPDDTHYELEQVMFSTCPPANRKWHIEAKNIDIDTDKGRGEAYNATFRLGNVPVLYLPYFNFPVDDRRSSGLLTPSVRVDSDSGLRLSVPYYLNLAPNYDATLTTDIYTNRNPMLTGELRYLTENFGEGSLTSAYMPDDKEYNREDRSAVFYRHNWASKSIPNLSADAVFSYVSDPNYLSDFDDYGLAENRLNLPRRARVNYYDDYIDAQLKVETFQSLKALDVNGNPVTDKDKPYSRLPQLSVNYRLPQLNNVLDNFVITGTHDSAYFKKSINDGSENEKSGVRLYNQVNASYPIEKTWGYVTPTASLHHLYTAYDEESRIDNNISKDDNSQSVFVPRFTLESGLNFYQAGSPFGIFDNTMGGYQLLTPQLKYSYSPYKDQSRLPNFDTRIASLDYDQLFEDSWYLGYDRISDNNNLAVGLNYRYIDAMGITRFDGSIGDQFFLSKPKVTLEEGDRTFESSSTGVAWRSSVQPYRNLWFDFNGALDSDNNLNYISSQVRYRPSPHSQFNFGVVERKEDRLTSQSKLSALTASAIVPITNNWRFMGQTQWDSDNNRFIDSTVGVDYEDCCYGFSIYGRSYYNDLNFEEKPTRAIMAEFRINGFGDRRGRLSKHLDRKIMGFEPIDDRWRSNSQYSK